MSPSRDWRERVQDILDAIAEIQKFTHETDFNSFAKDPRSVRAVEMNFIIIGESAGRIPLEIEAAYPQIPWALMRAMRNRIVHDYFQVDEKLLWDTIQNDLPPLIDPLKKLL